MPARLRFFLTMAKCNGSLEIASTVASTALAKRLPGSGRIAAYHATAFSALHLPQLAIRPVISLFEEVRFDLLPRNNGRGVSPIRCHAPVEFCGLLITQGRSLRFNVLPESVQKF